MTTYDQPLLSPLGDSAVVVTFGDDITDATHRRVRALSAYLDRHSPEAMIEYVPAFTTVTVTYDPLVRSYESFAKALQGALADTPEPSEVPQPEVVEIPVCYGGELGPDLDSVASAHNLSREEVVDIHTAPEYVVYMIGFAPGFPYLGGMSDKIATPRRDSPRQKIPTGSVGIAGKQTGIYPIETPGGWQLIGRTPLRLFRPEAAEPSLLAAGDRLRFASIPQEAYENLLRREQA